MQMVPGYCQLDTQEDTSTRKQNPVYGWLGRSLAVSLGVLPFCLPWHVYHTPESQLLFTRSYRTAAQPLPHPNYR